MRFSRPKKVIGLDIGSHSVKAVQMSRSGAKLSIENIGYALVDRAQVNLDPVMAHANAVRAAVGAMPVGQCEIIGALPGQTAVVRYPRIQAGMPDDQLDQAIEGEAAQNIPYDLFEVFLDWSAVGEEGEGDDKQLKILLVAAKHEVIDARVQIANAAEIEFGVLGVDSLALADAAEGCDFLRTGESAALINIGASSASIHFMKDGVSNFIRDVSWGARELIQAIAKSRHCDYDEAERILYNVEEELAAQSSAAEVPSTMAETVAATEQVVEPEPVSSGSGSLLDPLDDELGALMEEEPASSGVAAGSIADEGAMAAMGIDEHTTLEQALSIPVARLVSEIRRSFDYYEHQLYESPVDRIILSGGIAHVSLVQKALVEDLGVDDVNIANLLDGAIEVHTSVKSDEFDNFPAIFMVAVGLAARGATEL